MIHVISKEYYLKHKTQGEMRKILIESQKFPLKYNKFYMKDGICFIYLMNLGFLIVPKDSNFTEDILNEEISKSEWYIEKFEKPHHLTKNYINSFPSFWLYEKPGFEWFFSYEGYIRVWNTLISEDYIFYKNTANSYKCCSSNPKSYFCRFVIGDKVKFPIDLNKSYEFNNFMKDIIEWI